ncbi:uncharacterized protein LOC112569342 isoform X2 [Pomacea canaliculata]|uniref:uncharacterized protein LOC112569342 isoform X2 n=1 Tax=Pomacea canaliculata TaxID=400727 RepID=UPI000D72F726|nr:uncharacterized protein LOC112569342 isoform X2 [Pomacea canaliculata]
MNILILFGLLAVALGQHSSFFSLDPEAIRQGFISIDMNHDDVVTLDDQLEWIRKYDLNEDGVVTLEEFTQNMPQVNDGIIKEMNALAVVG